MKWKIAIIKTGIFTLHKIVSVKVTGYMDIPQGEV